MSNYVLSHPEHFFNLNWCRLFFFFVFLVNKFSVVPHSLPKEHVSRRKKNDCDKLQPRSNALFLLSPGKVSKITRWKMRWGISQLSIAPAEKIGATPKPAPQNTSKEQHAYMVNTNENDPCLEFCFKHPLGFGTINNKGIEITHICSSSFVFYGTRQPSERLYFLL